MRKEEIKYFCDICKKEIDEMDCLSVNYPVIFTTDQTNKVISMSYIGQKSIDICRRCAGKILKITASASPNFDGYKIVAKENKVKTIKQE